MANSRSGNPARRNAAPRSILIASNSPWAETGYGQQTAQLSRRLKRDGHKIAFAANYGLEGTTSEWEGMPIYPRGFDLHSSDVVPAYMHAWQHRNPDLDPLLLTLYDVWVYRGPQWDTVQNIASWVPIDHYPIPPDVLAFVRRDNVTPIAMSKFGQQMLQQASVECEYAPHAIDTNVFKPTPDFDSPMGRMTGRQFMGIDDPDAFVVTMVSANKGQVPNRKAFPESFLAFAMFAKEYPEAVLYCHTESKGAMGGIDLEILAKSCGIKESQIKFPDPFIWRMGIPANVLAAIYTGSDCLLQPSMGEGFGIPLIEAQACGLRAVVSNATAQPELLGDGWLVEGQPWWDPMQRAWLHAPRVDSIIEGLINVYNCPRGPSERAMKFASYYDADAIYAKHWRPILERV